MKKCEALTNISCIYATRHKLNADDDDKRTVNNNYNSNTVVKQDFAVVKQVDGRRHT